MVQAPSPHATTAATDFWTVPHNGLPSNPLLCARRLRARIRALREARALTQAELAAEMDWSTSKVLRMEAGTSRAGRSDMLALGRFYGLGDDEQQQLLEWSTVARKARWWWSDLGGVLDGSAGDYLAYESTAVAIQEYHSTVMPAPLRCPRYHQLIAARPSRGEANLPLRGVDDAERAAVSATLAARRQTAIEQNPARTRYLLSERLLWAPPCGDVSALIEQLDFLCVLARHSRTEVAVVPFDAGANWGMKYSLIKMFGLPPTADDAHELDLVRVDYDAWGHPALSTTDEWVHEGRIALAQIHSVALSTSDNVSFIEEVRRHVTEGTSLAASFGIPHR